MKYSLIFKKCPPIAIRCCFNGSVSFKKQISKDKSFQWWNGRGYPLKCQICKYKKSSSIPSCAGAVLDITQWLTLTENAAKHKIFFLNIALKTGQLALSHCQHKADYHISSESEFCWFYPAAAWVRKLDTAANRMSVPTKALNNRQFCTFLFSSQIQELDYSVMSYNYSS